MIRLDLGMVGVVEDTYTLL